MALVDGLARLRVEGDVVDAERVAVVRTRMRIGLLRAQAEPAAAAAQVHDGLALLADDRLDAIPAERAEQLLVEAAAELEIGHDEVDVADRAGGHRCSLPACSTTASAPCSTASSGRTPTSASAGSAAEARSRQVAPSTGRFLFSFVAPQTDCEVLEIGGSRGYSTIWLAAGARYLGGRVLSLEHDPVKCEAWRANVAEAGLDEWAELLEGDAFETLPAIDDVFDSSSWTPRRTTTSGCSSSRGARSSRAA